MQATSAILTSALTSAVVTAIVTAILRHFFDKRLLNMEKRLDRVYDNLLETDKQRRQTFQRVAQQVYRTRNIAKELSEQAVVDETLVNEFMNVVKNLETDIYEFRLILEIEGVIDVHAFKNEAKAIVGLTRDLAFHQATADGEHEKLMADILNCYAEVDRQYSAIIDRLTARSKATELV